MRNLGIIRFTGTSAPAMGVGDVVAYKQSPVSQGGMRFLTVTSPDNGDGTFTATRNGHESNYWLERVYWNDTTGEIRS